MQQFDDETLMNMSFLLGIRQNINVSLPLQLEITTIMTKKHYLSGIILLAFILLSYLFICNLDEEKALRLSVEDGIIEYLSGIFFFIAAIISFYHFFVVSSLDRIYFLHARRNYLILLLGLFFLFCAGEEISWGQRILGLETPEYMIRENAQKEFNFHNLYMFQGTDKDLNLKTGIRYWFTGHKIFAYFWITFCILIPFASAVFARLRQLLKKIYFPVMPVWLGVLFLVNHFASKACEGMHVFSWPTPIVETKETLFALLFLISAICFYSNHRQQIKGSS